MIYMIYMPNLCTRIVCIDNEINDASLLGRQAVDRERDHEDLVYSMNLISKIYL